MRSLAMTLTGLCALAFSSAAPAAIEIERWHTGNGARVLFYAAPQVPMLDLRATFDAGSARDGDQPGVARLTNGLLAEGAAGMDAQTIAERLEEVGARLGNDSLRDMNWVSLRTLSDPQYRDPALAVYKAILTQPDFNESDVERTRAQMLTGLERIKQSPGRLAQRAFYKALYRDHPYASPPNGTEQSVEALRAEDLRAFHRRFFVAENLTLAIVGDIDKQTAQRIAEQLSAALPAGKAPAPLPEPTPLEQGERIHIEFASRQSHVLLGTLGMARDDRHYFDLYVANHVFGGSGFSSRLLGTVRETHGLAYSAYSYFLPSAVPGPFLLGMQTRNEQAEQATELALGELRKFVDEGVTEDEMQASVQNIVGGFPLKIDSNRKLLEYLTLIGFYRLELDYLDRFNDRVEAVSGASAREAFADRVDPDKLVTVVVGGSS